MSIGAGTEADGKVSDHGNSRASDLSAEKRDQEREGVAFGPKRGESAVGRASKYQEKSEGAENPFI